MTKVFRILLALTVVVAVGTLVWMGVPSTPDLVVYTSSDDQYSRPLVAAFEKESGLEVGLVTDAEAAKTTGLYQRLLAERKSPRADVFWNNEISRTLLLSRKGALRKWTPSDLKGVPDEFRDPKGRWYGLACRVRVIIYNKEKVTDRDAPGSVFELVEERWKGRAAMAYPLFGTTATHCAALRAHPKMGREKANRFFRELVKNEIRVVEGNSVVAKMVGRGAVDVGLTDTDDAWNVIAAGMPVALVYPDQRSQEFGALVIPNTATMIAGCRHPEAAQEFLDFLMSARAEKMLAAPPARHLPVRQGVKADKDAQPLYMIRPMEVDWEKVADEVEAQVKDLEEIFPR
ncbi:MAG: extracellular solute-binding protein [Planctomycetota bacterium]|jgi:iron(III) transport system substrate-binding protein